MMYFRRGGTSYDYRSTSFLSKVEADRVDILEKAAFFKNYEPIKSVTKSKNENS